MKTILSRYTAKLAVFLALAFLSIGYIAQIPEGNIDWNETQFITESRIRLSVRAPETVESTRSISLREFHLIYALH